MPDPTDRDYKAQLGDVLRRRDPAALHRFLRQSAASYGDERQVAEVEERSHAEMEELMHRMILTRADLADLHAASRGWLAAHDPPFRPPVAPDQGGRSPGGQARGARRSQRRWRPRGPGG
jgi:hypothetical protein